ncbi:MAG: hypothetical protein JNJ41_00795 [Bacteroidia bacterium]|nr:hypothetical protein [Bacteroidia bacterium]
MRSWDNVFDLFSKNQISIKTPMPSNKKNLLALTGSFNQKVIQVNTYYVGSGKNRTIVTRMDIFLDNGQLAEFSLYKETIFSKLGELLGSVDIKTGNAEFDKTFRLKSKNETETQKIFNDEVINHCQNVKKDFTGTILSKENKLSFFMNGLPGNKMQLLHFNCLLSIVLLLTKHSSKPSGHSPKN